MDTQKLKVKEIQEAIADLKVLLKGKEANIESVSLFGSTVDMPIESAEDIDFFISYKGLEFLNLRDDILKVKVGRNVVVENHEAQYTNHPTWPRESPLRIHIILFRENVSKFSEKLLRTKKTSIDITHLLKS